MNIKHSMMIVALLLVGLFIMIPTNAMAKGIFEHKDTLVPVNQTVNDVVVVGGDATIWGTVNDSVIVLNGNAVIKESAKINGFVLVIGGNVQQEHGAVITDEIINVSLNTATKNSLLIGGGLVVGTWLLQLAVSIVFVILPVLIVFLSKQRIHSFVDRARQSPGYFLYIGFFSSLILVAITVLLLLTIIGIPIAMFIFVLVVLAFLFGLSVLSMLVGERIQGTFTRSNWMISLTGSVLLVSLMNVPFIGELLFLGVAVFSIGIMTLWISEKLKRKPSARS